MYRDNNVNRITREELLQLKDYVIEYLMRDRGLSSETAQTLVEESTFHEILFEEPEFVMHFSVKYWAEDVLEENSVAN